MPFVDTRYELSKDVVKALQKLRALKLQAQRKPTEPQTANPES